jgi:hypothetical protein
MDIDFKSPRWAHVELFGHISYFDRVREIDAFGGRMGCIESLSPDGLSEEPVIFGAGALYRVTPMTEEACRRAVLPRSYGACDTFTSAPVLPERCADCGYTLPEHEEARTRGRLLLAAPETSREGSGRPPAPEESDIPFDETPWGPHPRPR